MLNRPVTGTRRPACRTSLFRLAIPVLSFAIVPLFWGCEKNAPVPVARFTYEAGIAPALPCTVNFINKSENAFSYAWWFGVDSCVTTVDEPGAMSENPVWIYRRAGTFRITLRAYNESRGEWATRVDTIVVGSGAAGK